MVEVIDCGTRGQQGQMRLQAWVTRESRKVTGPGPAEDVHGPGLWDVLPSRPGCIVLVGGSLEMWSVHREPSALREQRKVGEGRARP